MFKYKTRWGRTFENSEWITGKSVQKVENSEDKIICTEKNKIKQPKLWFDLINFFLNLRMPHYVTLDDLELTA